MTWILLTIPFMILAVAIAVLPVLLMSLRESRRIATEASLLGNESRRTVELRPGREERRAA